MSYDALCYPERAENASAFCGKLLKFGALGFAQDQHNAIKKTHYDPIVARLKAEGLDLSTRGPAVQDALWSTSVQFGPAHHKGAGGPDIFEKGLNEKFGKGYDLSKLSDKDIVEAVQDYKIKHNEHLFSGSPKLWHSLEDRAKHEKADLLKLADHEKTLDKKGAAHASTTESLVHGAVHHHHAAGPRLDDPKNPDHPLYEQARTAVHHLDASMGRTSDMQSDQLAASLVAAAKHKGMTSIDAVVLSEDGSRAFAVQGRLDSPLRQVAFVPTAEAVNTPIDKSSAAVQLVNQQQAQQQAQTQTPVQAPIQPAPAISR